MTMQMIPLKLSCKGNEPEVILSPAELLAQWEKKHFYELAFTSDTEMVNLFGDLDVEVKGKTREEFEKLDDQYRVALKTHIGSHTFALASGSNYEANKISWRFYIPDLIGTAQAQKEYIENINRERLITLPDGTPVKLDCSIYHKGRKMRMLHAWKQTKDENNNLQEDISKWDKRVLRLIEGLPQNTIIHNISENAEVMKTKQKKIVPLNQDEPELWRKLVMECWSDERANDYTSWRNGIWAIKSAENNEEGLKLAHDFAGRSYKYSERETDKVWREGQCKITGKSIHYWARQDNPIKYAELTAKLPIAFLESQLKNGDEGLGNIFAKSFEGTVVSIAHTTRNTYWTFKPKEGLWGEINADSLITKFTGNMQNILNPVAIKLREESADLEKDDPKKKQCDALLSLIASMNKTSVATRCMPQVKTKIQVSKDWEQKLNNDPSVLPVENGVLCLKTGTLRPYELEDYLTSKLSVSYDEEADTSKVDEFISQLLNKNKEAQDFLQYWFGYGITGENNRQELLIEEGTDNGANAKSHFNTCLKNVLGSFFTTGDRKAFSIRGDSVNNDSLFNARFSRLVVINELNKTDVLDEGQIKNYTGSEEVSVSAKFKNDITYTPKFKIILPLNNMIKVPASQLALWRRIIMLQFKVRFISRDQHDWDEEDYKKGWIVERDDKKGIELKNDRQGWLRWLVKGSIKYYQNPSIVIPASLQEHLLQTQEENDEYLKFIRNEYVADSSSKNNYIIVKELTNAVPKEKDLSERQHCNRISSTLKRMSISQSTRSITNDSKKTEVKKVWAGLRKKTQEEKDAEE